MVAELAMEYFYFELTAEGEEAVDLEKAIISKARKLPLIASIWQQIKSSLVLATSMIELEIK